MYLVPHQRLPAVPAGDDGEVGESHDAGTGAAKEACTSTRIVMLLCYKLSPPPLCHTALTAAMTGESTLAPPCSTIRAAASLQGSPPPRNIPVMFRT